MLVLTRKIDEEIIIGDGINEPIRFTIVKINKDQVRVGITAPESQKIFRKEICPAEVINGTGLG